MAKEIIVISCNSSKLGHSAF